MFYRWLENNYARVPDYKEEQERLQWVREESERQEMLKIGEEEDLRLVREERESRELEEILRKCKVEGARNQFQDKVHIKNNNDEEEEQIYEQLDNYKQEAYELKQGRFANFKLTDDQRRSEWENEKGPDPPERGKSVKLGLEVTNKSHTEHDEKLYTALSCLGGSIRSTEDDVDEIYMKGGGSATRCFAGDLSKEETTASFSNRFSKASS